jgi:hypothetical protein
MDTMTPMIAKIITVTVLKVGSNIQLPQILRPPADISGDIFGRSIFTRCHNQGKNSSIYDATPPWVPMAEGWRY